MPYTKQTWADGQAGNTPITAARLNHIEDGVAAATTAAEAADTVTAANITDSTAVGRNVLTATDQAAARTAIGAGTSSLAIGTTASTAAAGNHSHTATQVTATPVGGGSATTVQGILAELAARIATLEAATP
ncbi:head fiber protein [Mycobacterium phage Dori]|uniref:head fiber protein n=1 Tax=Mycobacterium phage Dori TaxID=1089121 RepID=UPI000232F496|nr:head fiber protein [Mycobacterium phage Dori]AER47669.1 hypothetical protein DORI_18 [Mycobacterium phage Dori]UVT31451.1 head decoration protein [Mycobacterium phage Sejanus]UVT31551.1 capsid decoration protein [Mycobacterium phage Mask]